jgi:hypothetical protein
MARSNTQTDRRNEDKMDTIADAIARNINSIPGFSARAWTNAPGKERVYVEFGPKQNGGKRWHGGLGWTAYLDMTTNEWRDESWAGAATRNAYEDRIDGMKENCR